MKAYTIASGDDGMRLDRFLFRVLPNAGRGFLEKMLRKKNIVVNDRKTKGNVRLSAGDEVKIYFSDETFHKFAASDQTSEFYERLSGAHDFRDYIDILFEDEDLLVLNKPAGLLSQRDSRDVFSLNEYMLSYLIHFKGLSREDFSDFRPSVMNRLDFNTSGIVLAAKTRDMARKLSFHLKNKDITKTYRALVFGRFEVDDTFRAFLTKDDRSNQVTLSQSPKRGAKEIASVFTTVHATDAFSAIDARLITGKSHQLRAQLAFLGHPILLDPKYGDRARNKKLLTDYQLPDTGQLLHARHVKLFDGREFEAPLPEAFHRIGGER